MIYEKQNIEVGDKMTIIEVLACQLKKYII